MPDSVNKTYTMNSLQVLLQEKLYNLEELFQNNVPEEIYNAIEEEEGTLCSPIRLIGDVIELPSLPEYYIKRTLTYRSELDERIFQANTNHIFVVAGVALSILARANGFKEITRSGHLIGEEAIINQFIILEDGQDFEAICSKTSKPVHLIEYRNHAPYWVKSTKGLDMIRKFLKDEGELLEEKDALNKIITRSSPAYCISASPGMGKTMVLLSLALRIKEQKDNAVVLFIHLPELVKQIDTTNFQGLSLEALTRFATTRYVSELILRKMIENSNGFQFFLFFDGYDEISSDKLEFADSFLRAIIQLQNLVVIVATRSHLQSRLENVLKRLSLAILPLRESNQIEFLKKYWISRYSAHETPFLTQYAIKCLSAFEQLRKDDEGNIYEVPLQCLLLAEINAENARRVSETSRLPEDDAEFFSFFEMFRSLILLKFNIIPDKSLKQQYIDAHVNEAIKHLFPQWLTKFNPILQPRENVEENLMYSIGLIEKCPNQNSSRFVHRTYAEYFLAEFIANNVDKDESCLIFLCEGLFGRQGVIMQEWRDVYTNKIERPTQYILKYTQIANFVEKHFENSPNVPKLNRLAVNTIDEEAVCLAAAACGSNNLEYCFDLLKIILQNVDIRSRPNIAESHFKHLPYLVVESTSNPSLVEKVLNFTEAKFETSLDWHRFDSEYRLGKELWIPDCTPLHVAVYRGKYNILIYLLQQYKDARSIKYLIHACVDNSAKNKDSVIEEKIGIIDALTQLSRNWLDEEFDSINPLVAKNVHVKLLKHVVQLGIDINTFDEFYGTVLHTGGDVNTYPDLVRWAYNEGFKLTNHTDGYKFTPLMRAINRFGTLDEETLQLFHQNGAEINVQDNLGNSILFHAIQHSNNLDFVHQILDLGANPTHRNKLEQNAGHWVIMYHRENKILSLELFKLLRSKGFKGFQQVDEYGDSPRVSAIVANIIDNEILEAFVKAGVDDDGNSFLFQAIQHSAGLNIIREFLEFGDDVNHRNHQGESVAHLVIEHHQSRPEVALELLQLLKSYGFKDFEQITSKKFDSTLIKAIMSNSVKADSLKLYHVAGADFNAQDEYGYSVLFHALCKSNSIEFIQKILEFGANPNHTNKHGQNAAHLVITYYRHNPDLALTLLKLLDSNGFQGFNQRDTAGETPYTLALKKEIQNEELLIFLRSKNKVFKCSMR